ncbi:YutD family protein [Lentilactobacillus parafarraginis]|nr:YutD family protein [Lentilactobacillus parafarraginis]
MDRKQLDTLIAQRDENRHPLAQIRRESETEFTINNHKYEVVHSFNDGFNFEEFIRRYNPALSQYDYIVGDWGYGQLRLKGFYSETRDEVKGPFITALNDYLLEDVNFGSANFVVHNLEARPVIRKASHSRSRRHSGRNRSRNNNSRSNPGRQQNSRNHDNPQHEHQNNHENETKHRNHNGNRRNHRNHAFVEQKVKPVKPSLEKRDNLVVTKEAESNNHHFIIRESKK